MGGQVRASRRSDRLSRPLAFSILPPASQGEPRHAEMQWLKWQALKPTVQPIRRICRPYKESIKVSYLIQITKEQEARCGRRVVEVRIGSPVRLTDPSGPGRCSGPTAPTVILAGPHSPKISLYPDISPQSHPQPCHDSKHVSK